MMDACDLQGWARPWEEALEAADLKDSLRAVFPIEPRNVYPTFAIRVSDYSLGTIIVRCVFGYLAADLTITAEALIQTAPIDFPGVSVLMLPDGTTNNYPSPTAPALVGVFVNTFGAHGFTGTYSVNVSREVMG